MRSHNYKIFFNHGEGKSIPNKQFQNLKSLEESRTLVETVLQCNIPVASPFVLTLRGRGGGAKKQLSLLRNLLDSRKVGSRKKLHFLRLCPVIDLRVEVGRWSRTPRDQRICSCGTGIQDEFHLFQCPFVRDLLTTPGKTYSSPSYIFQDTNIADMQALHNALNRLYDVAEQSSE